MFSWKKTDALSQTLRDNLRRTGFEDRAETVQGDVEKRLELLNKTGQTFRLILVDPPYRIAATELEGVLSRLPSLIEPGGRVVVERGEAPEEVVIGNMKGVTRRYGGTNISIFERLDFSS